VPVKRVRLSDAEPLDLGSDPLRALLQGKQKGIIVRRATMRFGQQPPRAPFNTLASTFPAFLPTSAISFPSCSANLPNPTTYSVAVLRVASISRSRSLPLRRPFPLQPNPPPRTTSLFD
jgi:hypothetical protein